MNKKIFEILLIEDNIDHAELTSQAFALHSTPDKQFNITVAGNLAKARAALTDFNPDLIIADLMLPDGQGTTLLPGPREHATTPIIMMTSHRDEQVAVEAIKAGALDYVVKSGTNWTDIPRVAERALREWQHIVERAQAETALRESQRTLQTLLDNLPGMAYRCRNDPDWTMEFVSQGCFDLTGHAPSQLIGNQTVSYGQLIDPADRDYVWNEIQTHLKQDQAFQLTYRITTAQGMTKWVWEQGRGIFDDQGTLVALEGFIIDISERIRAERQAHERQTYLEKVLDSVPDAIVTLDPQHHVVEWNPGAQKLFGYTPEQATGHDLDHLINSPETWEAAVQLTQSALRGETVGPMETVRYRQDGTPVNVILAGSPILLEDELIGIVAVYTDITARVQAAQTLQRRTQELELLYQASRQLSRTLDLTAVYETLHSLIAGVMDCAGLYISSYDPADQLIRCSRAWHEGKALDTSTFPAIPLEPQGQGIQSEVIRTGKSLLISNYPARLKNTQTKYHVSHQEIVKEIGDDIEQTRSALLTPLKLEGKVVGVIQVFSYRYDAYTENDLKIFESLALQVATASANASLYQRAQTELAERRRVEEALRQSEQRYRGIFEGIQDAIFVESLAGDILDVNARTCEMFGWTRQELLNKTVHDLVPDDSFLLLPAGASGEELPSQPVETVNIRADGGRFPVEVTARLQNIGDETVMLVVVRDVTKRVQAEEALRHSQERLQLALEATSDGLWDLDVSTGNAYFSPRYYTMLGYKPDELPASYETWASLLHPQERQSTIDTIQENLAQGAEIYRVKFRMRAKSGEWRWIMSKSKAVEKDQDGNPTRLVGTHTDITEQVQAQEREERFLKQQIAVNQLALALEEPRDLDKIYHTIYEHIRTLMDSETFIVSFYDREKGQIRAGYVVNQDTVQDTTKFPRIPLATEGHGTQSRVIRNGEPLYIPDWRQAMTTTETEYKIAADGTVSPGPPPADQQPQSTNSALLVPMKVEGETIGVIQVQSHRLDAYTPEDLDLLVALTNVATIAIQNAQLYQEVHDRATRQEALNAIIAAAVAEPDLTDLLRTTLKHTLQALGAHRGAIWLPNHSATQGFPTDFSTNARQTFQVAELDIPHPLAITDWSQIPDSAPWAHLAPMMMRFDVQASLVAPILVQGRRIGGFGIAADQPRTWTPEEVALLEAVGQQIGAAAQRRRLLAQTRQQAQQMQHLLDAVPEGVILLDADGDILLQNPTARAALSVLTDVAAGVPLTHLGSHPLSNILDRYADPLPVEIALPSKRIFEAQARPIGANENRQWVLALREVTQERKIKSQMQSQERLATVGQLAAGIAHDFNNIMSSVVLYASMLLRSPNLSPKEKQRVDTIRQQGHRAAHLVQQILDFARKAVMEQQPIDLLPFLKELEKLLARTLPENIKLQIHYGHDQYVVNADPTRIQQMVMNLALNARDAMPQGGTLNFTLSRLALESGATPPLRDLSPGEWVCISVADTGTGISPDVLPHIFEPFFTTKGVGKGTGLGLAQVYGIVGSHGGHIDVSSQVGHGTTFIIYLPALPIADVDPQSAQVSDLVKGNGQTILVVEDDVATRQALSDILEDLGYHVLTATNGEGAQALMQQHGHQITLVLSDLVMPEMGGAELYALIQAQYPHTKMIMITGYPSANQDKALLEQGITAWLQKPFSTDDIAQIVAQALQDSSQKRPGRPC